MPTEVRPITRDEAVDYLKVLPFANGLPMWEPFPAAWHGGSGAWPAPRPPAGPERLQSLVDEVMADHFHPVAAIVDGRTVGASAMISFEVTVPGHRQVPAGGVTATGVIATHRRRGLLRRMMQDMFDRALQRGEPLAMLSASEGSIYGRFGFSPATVRTRWEVERTQATFLAADAPSGSLELTDAATARNAWPAIHEAVRRTRVGELSAQPDQWAGLSDTPDGTAGPLRYLAHRDGHGTIDGIANFRLPWSPVIEEAGTLVVEGLHATTPDSYRAMWQLLLDFDLTRKIVAAKRPADEPLRWMLQNPRALRVTRQSDNLWMRLLDLRRALESRAYSVPGTLVLRIASDSMCPRNEGVWRLEGDPDGARCTRVDADPDLTLDIPALGSLYLGGASASLLATAGRIRDHRPEAVGLLSRMFRTDPEPFNSFVF
ncbi:MAG: GNAT family N-acetyltransferase [Streptosporangiales bacterium]